MICDLVFFRSIMKCGLSSTYCIYKWMGWKGVGSYGKEWWIL